MQVGQKCRHSQFCRCRERSNSLGGWRGQWKMHPGWFFSVPPYIPETAHGGGREATTKEKDASDAPRSLKCFTVCQSWPSASRSKWQPVLLFRSQREGFKSKSCPIFGHTSWSEKKFFFPLFCLQRNRIRARVQGDETDRMMELVVDEKKRKKKIRP